MQGELMAAVGDAAPRRPAVLLEHVLDPQVLHQPVAQGGVDLDDVVPFTVKISGKSLIDEPWGTSNPSA
jgi:hypothetical protein